MLKSLLLAAALSLPTAALAQSLIPCDGWQASARNLIDPWEDATRTFANGDIRIAQLDTVEPASGAVYIMVIAPPRDEMGNRGCNLVAEDGGGGLAAVDITRADAVYDPSRGLEIFMPASRYQPGNDSYYDVVLSIVINQAAGTVTPSFY